MGKFSGIMKKIELTPVYKKDVFNDKPNLRPVSTVSNLSKAFEKLIYSQINTYSYMYQYYQYIYEYVYMYVYIYIYIIYR